MAGSSLFALIDDIATILDDVALMSKVAAKKTAGVLGDDLALNAQQVAGVRADRELPVVWAVALGSLKNKAILVPAISAAPLRGWGGRVGHGMSLVASNIKGAILTQRQGAAIWLRSYNVRCRAAPLRLTME